MNDEVTRSGERTIDEPEQQKSSGPEDIVDVMRRIWVVDDGIARTHWIDCWKVHHECATARLCDTIESLQAEVERADDVKLLCVQILACDPQETTEGARYLAADVLGRLTGKSATDLLNGIVEALS